MVSRSPKLGQMLSVSWSWSGGLKGRPASAMIFSDALWWKCVDIFSYFHFLLFPNRTSRAEPGKIVDMLILYHIWYHIINKPRVEAKDVQNMLKLLIILVENISPRQRANYVIWTLLLNIWNLIFQKQDKVVFRRHSAGLVRRWSSTNDRFSNWENWFTKVQNITKRYKKLHDVTRRYTTL